MFLLRATRCTRSNGCLALSPRWSSSTSVSDVDVDTVVIGAGVMGLNAAYQLRRRDPSMKIIVLEAGESLGSRGSSGSSSAILRCFYTHTTMIEVAKDGINSYLNWKDYLQLPADEEPLANFTRTGMLFYGENWKTAPEEMQAHVDRLTSCGVRAEVLYKTDVRERWPRLSGCGKPFDNYGNTEHGECEDFPEDVPIAVLEPDAGYFDPTSSMADLVNVLKGREDVDVRFKSSVVNVHSADGAVQGVTVSDGSTGSEYKINAKTVINASGPWVNQLLDMAGVTIPNLTLKPTRVQVFYKTIDDYALVDAKNNTAGLPIVCDLLSGAYFRPQIKSGQILMGGVTERDESEVVDPDDFALHGDDMDQMRFVSSLHHRITDMPTKGRVVGMGALYTITHEDVHPVIGELPGLKGFVLMNGFSGHGFKCAPAFGSMVAQQPLTMSTKNVMA